MADANADARGAHKVRVEAAIRQSEVVKRDSRPSRRYFVLAALAFCLLVIALAVQLFTALDLLGSVLSLLGAVLACVALWVGHLDRQKA